jgi:hypothetical protein
VGEEELQTRAGSGGRALEERDAGEGEELMVAADALSAARHGRAQFGCRCGWRAEEADG